MTRDIYTYWLKANGAVVVLAEKHAKRVESCLSVLFQPAYEFISR